MRIRTAGLVLTAIGFAGCGTTPGPHAAIGTAARPAYYIARPPPGERRCVVWGEDMYGRRFCDRYYPS